MEPTERRLDQLPPEIIERIAKRLHSKWRGTFLINDDEQQEMLENYRALRLTCKELYLKTFRDFALTYFTRISVAFSVKSLRRLRELANHNNSFGLSLTSFPQELMCSTYRLPVDGTVQNALMLTTDPIRNAEAEVVAKAIAVACKTGIKQPFTGGSSHTRAVIRQYKEAASEQGSIESSRYDIRLLAESLAALPKIHTVDCSEALGAWGVPDWDALAGIDMESVLHMEYAASGTTSLTIVAKKVLTAIAQASALRRARGQRLSLQQLSLGGVMEPEVDTKFRGSPYMVQLHTLDLSEIQAPLEDACSQLKRFRIGVCGTGFSGEGTENDSNMEKSKATLEILLSPTWARTIEQLQVDFQDDLPGDRDHDEIICNDADLINVMIDAQHFTRLRQIAIHSFGLRHEVPALLRLIEVNAATLEELNLTSAQGSDMDADETSELWRRVLEAAAGCTKLGLFILCVCSEGEGNDDININVWWPAKVAALLANLLVSPRRAGEALGWVVEESEESS